MQEDGKGTERLELDHVVLGVIDLDEAARDLLEDHGLIALTGGHHPLWGTANRIVPLGGAYLELVAVVDPDIAATTPFGRWVDDMASGRCDWGWAVRTHDVAATATRLGLDVVPGSRVTPAGADLRWQLAGLPVEGSDRTQPFFIEWGVGSPLPGTAFADHPAHGAHVRRVDVETDAAALGRLLDDADLPVTVRPGRRGVIAVEVATEGASILLEPGQRRRASTVRRGRPST